MQLASFCQTCCSCSGAVSGTGQGPTRDRMGDQGKTERKNNGGARGLLLVKIQDRGKSQIHPFLEKLMNAKPQLSPGIIFMSGGAHDGGILQS